VAKSSNFWHEVVARYRQIGLPFVPDTALVNQISAMADEIGGLGLVLGATPAYADLPAPITACDIDPVTLSAIWPKDRPDLNAVQSDWSNMPFADGQFLRIYGDGSLNSLTSLAAIEVVLRECKRLLAPGGIALFRCYVHETPLPTYEALVKSPPFGMSLSGLRLLLYTHFARSPDFQCRVGDMLAPMEAAHGSAAAFLKVAGLDPALDGLFEAARGSPLVYLFPDRQTFLDLARSAGFTADFVETTGYECAKICPVLKLALTPV